MVDYSCLLSALCFLVSNSLGIAVVVLDMNRVHFDFENWKALDPEFLQQEWEHRRYIAPLYQTANIFNAFAWFFFSVPIVQLAWALSRGGKRRVGVHAAIGVFAMAGCFSELISRLLIFGSWTSSNWIAKTFNLDFWLPDSVTQGSADMLGWRALEVTFIVTEGLVLWIDAFEWIALFCILVLLYFSVGTQLKENRTVSMWWARLGLFIAFLTFIDFSADVLRLEEWQAFSLVAIAVAVINTMILLPLWLIILSCQLHKALPAYNEGNDQWTPQVQSAS